MQVDGQIMKIMKAKKTMHYKDIEKDAISNITLFKANEKQIKKRMEALLEREYIKRDETDQ